MITNILDPNRDVDPRYLAYQFLLEDGRILVGVIENETETTITLRDSEGKPESLLREEIEEIKSTSMSLMPENLAGEISPQDMSDLIRYVINHAS